MHDKIIHNPKICLERTGHSVTPIRSRDIYRPLGWSNGPLGVDIDHFENHWVNCSLSSRKTAIRLKTKRLTCITTAQCIIEMLLANNISKNRWWVHQDN